MVDLVTAVRSVRTEMNVAPALVIPLVLAGRCVGTMNLLHEAGWYTEPDEPAGLLLGAFLLPALAQRPIA